MAAALSRALKLPGKMLFMEQPHTQRDSLTDELSNHPRGSGFALTDSVLHALFDHVTQHTTYIRVIVVYKCPNIVV